MAMSKLALKETVNFVEPLTEEFKCPICLELLQNPYLSACCGNHFCESCANEVRKNVNKCPLCQERPLNGIINKGLKRKVNELKVYCLYKETGCDWMGDFGKIEQHLAVDKTNGECQFVVVKCPISKQCGAKISRKSLENHVNDACVYRPFRCKYCDYQSTYVVITTSHYEECLGYPVPCPNNCSTQTHPRGQLDNHLALCPEQEVACTFIEMGCKEKMKRQLLQKHMETNLLHHQMIMCEAYTVQNKAIKSLIKDKTQLEEQVAHLTLVTKAHNLFEECKLTISKEKEIDWPSYLSKMSVISFVCPVAPVVFEMPFSITTSRTQCACGNYNTMPTAQPYRSLPFYSHSKGYRLQLSAKLVNNCPTCIMKYLKSPNAPIVKRGNSILVDFHLMEGEQDHELKWPFKQYISITLLNKLNDSNHHRTELEYEGNRNQQLRPKRIAVDLNTVLRQQCDELCQPFMMFQNPLLQQKKEMNLFQKFYELTKPNSLFFPLDDDHVPSKSSLQMKKIRRNYENTLKFYFEIACSS